MKNPGPGWYLEPTPRISINLNKRVAQYGTPTNVHFVIQKGSALFQVSPKLLCSKRRYAPIVKARHAVCYALVKGLNMPFQAAGQAVGITDHSSVRYAVERVGKWAEGDRILAKHLLRLTIDTCRY